jgi:hypothetical protein
VRGLATPLTEPAGEVGGGQTRGPDPAGIRPDA